MRNAKFLRNSVINEVSGLPQPWVWFFLTIPFLYIVLAPIFMIGLLALYWMPFAALIFFGVFALVLLIVKSSIWNSVIALTFWIPFFIWDRWDVATKNPEYMQTWDYQLGSIVYISIAISHATLQGLLSVVCNRFGLGERLREKLRLLLNGGRIEKTREQ